MNLEIALEYEEAGRSSSSGETDFSDLFEGYVIGGNTRRCLPHFSAFFREVPATVGIADFIGLVAPRWGYTQRRLEHRFHGIPRAPAAEIVSHLRKELSVDREILIRKSQYTRSVVLSTLCDLIKSQVISNHVEDIYRLDPRFRFPKAEVHFYEIKIHKWRRALFQAEQAQSYADKSYCVFPPNKRRILLENRERFRSCGVGVILFDPTRWSVVELIPGRRRDPKRPADKLDLLIRLAASKNLL